MRMCLLPGVKCWPRVAVLLVAAGTGLAVAQTAPPPVAPATTPSSAQASLPPAVAQALQLPSGPARVKDLTAAAQAWAQQDPAAALTWAHQAPRPLQNEVAQIVQVASARAHGKIAADWAAQHEINWLHGLVYTWAGQDLPAATAWTMTAAPDNARDIAFFTIGDVMVRKNPPSATAWAVKLEAPKDRLSADRGIALIWARSKDLSAVTAWLTNLPKDEMLLAAKTVIDNWRYNKFNDGGKKNEAAVKEWLDSLPLTAAEKDAILNPPAASTNKAH